MNKWFGASRMVPLDYNGPVGLEFDHISQEWLDRPIAERFEWIARRHPGNLAVADHSRSLTYEEVRLWSHALHRAINAVAAPERPVGLLLAHDARFPVAALACLASGRPFVPIDLKFPAARIASIVQEAGMAAIVVAADTEAVRLVPSDIPIVDIGTLPESPPEPPALVGHADSMAVILYTSGSTGKPKGICNNQRAILQRVAEATNSCHVRHGDRILLLSSPGTIAGEREMFAALLNGAALFVTDPQHDGIHSVLRTAAEGRVTLCYAVPSLLRMLLRLPGASEALSALRVLRIGGDVTLASDLDLFRQIAPQSCHFFASFSSTETPAVFQWFVPPGWQANGPRVPIGYPRPGVDFAVVGEDGEPVAVGEIGELVVRSRYLALGQWQEGRLVAGPFAQDPEDATQRILRTGDLLRQREDGLWELFGRKDRQIKIRGQRIDTGEVESALRNCPSVADVAVIARRGVEGVTALAAFVAPATPVESQEQRDVLLGALKQALRARVPQYMHPADIRLLDAIPQLPGFKPDVAALERIDGELLEQQEREATAAKAKKSPAPDALQYNDRVREAVKRAWTVVLGARSYEADQTWEEANGDSLKAIELWFYIEDKLGFKLPLDAVDVDITPSALVATIRQHLEENREGRRSSRRPMADADNETPLVFLFPGIQDDDPALARFRAAFGKQVCFKLIDYPGWRDTAAASGSFDSIIDAAYARICAEPACEIYRVAGYSFGGIVAFEVAHRLRAAGQNVGFLGLLDTRRWDLTPMQNAGRFHAFLDELPNWKIDWLKAMVAGLIRQRRFGLLAGMERMLMLHPTRLAFWFKRRITREMRYQAFLQWKPAPLAVPTALYLSDDRWPREPEDYGWDTLCQPLTKVHIGGDHGTVIHSPQREKLCSAFVEAIRATPAMPLTSPTSATSPTSPTPAAPCFVVHP